MPGILLLLKLKLVKIKENGTINFETVDEKILELKIINFKIEDNHHWSFLIDNHIGHAVEI